MKTGTTSGSLLRIDKTRSLERIVEHLHTHCRDNRTDAILLGLSGGIDSSLLAAVAVQAMGRHLVHAAYLFDRYSGSDLRQNAHRVTDWLGISLEEKFTP